MRAVDGNRTCGILAIRYGPVIRTSWADRTSARQVTLPTEDLAGLLIAPKAKAQQAARRAGASLLLAPDSIGQLTRGHLITPSGELLTLAQTTAWRRGSSGGRFFGLTTLVVGVQGTRVAERWRGCGGRRDVYGESSFARERGRQRCSQLLARRDGLTRRRRDGVVGVLGDGERGGVGQGVADVVVVAAGAQQVPMVGVSGGLAEDSSTQAT